jgi:hypothetical protein
MAMIPSFTFWSWVMPPVEINYLLGDMQLYCQMIIVLSFV